MSIREHKEGSGTLEWGLCVGDGGDRGWGRDAGVCGDCGCRRFFRCGRRKQWKGVMR